MSFILLTSNESSNNGSVLVVEDDPSILRAIVTVLEKNGFKPLKAFTGVEGLKAALEYKPSVIISDIKMPIMDGLTMLEKLRQYEWGKDVEVIIYTNYNDKDLIEKARRHGVEDFYVKLDTPLAEIVDVVKSKL